MTPSLTPRQFMPWFLGGLLVILAVFVAPSYCGKRAAVTLDRWQAKVAADSARAAAREDSARRTLAGASATIARLRDSMAALGRDRAAAGQRERRALEMAGRLRRDSGRVVFVPVDTGKPAEPVGPETARAIDSLAAVVRADSALLARDSAALSTALMAADSLAAGARLLTRANADLHAEVDLLKHRPGPPRLTRSALLAYDPLHGVPVGGVAVELRVVGRLALAAQADYALDPGLPPARRARVMVGVRIPF